MRVKSKIKKWIGIIVLAITLAISQGIYTNQVLASPVVHTLTTENHPIQHNLGQAILVSPVKTPRPVYKLDRMRS